MNNKEISCLKKNKLIYPEIEEEITVNIPDNLSTEDSESYNKILIVYAIKAILKRFLSVNRVYTKNILKNYIEFLEKEIEIDKVSETVFKINIPNISTSREIFILYIHNLIMDLYRAGTIKQIEFNKKKEIIYNSIFNELITKIRDLKSLPSEILPGNNSKRKKVKNKLKLIIKNLSDVQLKNIIIASLFQNFIFYRQVPAAIIDTLSSDEVICIRCGHNVKKGKKRCNYCFSSLEYLRKQVYIGINRNKFFVIPLISENTHLLNPPHIFYDKNKCISALKLLSADISYRTQDKYEKHINNTNTETDKKEQYLMFDYNSYLDNRYLQLLVVDSSDKVIFIPESSLESSFIVVELKNIKIKENFDAENIFPEIIEIYFSFDEKYYGPYIFRRNQSISDAAMFFLADNSLHIENYSVLSENGDIIDNKSFMEQKISDWDVISVLRPIGYYIEIVFLNIREFFEISPGEKIKKIIDYAKKRYNLRDNNLCVVYGNRIIPEDSSFEEENIPQYDTLVLDYYRTLDIIIDNEVINIKAAENMSIGDIILNILNLYNGRYFYRRYAFVTKQGEDELTLDPETKVYELKSNRIFMKKRASTAINVRINIIGSIEKSLILEVEDNIRLSTIIGKVGEMIHYNNKNSRVCDIIYKGRILRPELSLSDIGFEDNDELIIVVS